MTTPPGLLVMPRDTAADARFCEEFYRAAAQPQLIVVGPQPVAFVGPRDSRLWADRHLEALGWALVALVPVLGGAIAWVAGVVS